MRTPLLHRLPLAACALGLAFSGASAAPPTFTVTPDTIRADASGTWRASLRVQNNGEWGLYPDSLALVWRDLDVEVNSHPRDGVTSLTAMVSVIQPAGAGETTGFDWNSPADFERGALTFKLFMHDAKKVAYAMEHSIVVAGNELYDRNPRVLIDLPGGRKVEVVHLVGQGVEGAALTEPAPGLLYVPPAGVSARMALRWAGQYVARGMAVSIVSQPGTGGSTGPADRSGPASVAAVEAALARFAKQPGVDPKRIVIWGLGDGGSTALLVAAKHSELQGVVAQNAEYDPWRAYRALAPADQEAFVKAVGRDSTSWRARAPGLVAQKITPAILVLHSASMGEGSRIAAEAFVAARAAKNLDTETRIDGDPGAPTAARRDFTRLANDFLARRFRP